MLESSKSIIKHIPHFLDYCEIEKGLSNSTQKTYKRYLKRLISWLKDIKKENLLPHELTTDDISDYKLYLSKKYKYKGKSLRKITQHYYLIALRALLSYFTAKDIVSLLTNKVKLPKYKPEEKTARPLTLNEIKKLLSAPNVKKEIGLRDRAILETIIHTGLKVSQLVSLNRDQIKINDYIVDSSKTISLPRETLPWLKKYLESRKDKARALFIHYRSRKGVENRLMARSIERIVKKHEKKIGLPFPITPEILRWAYAHSLLDEQNKPKIIQRPQIHKIFVIKNYRYTINKRPSKKSAEKQIFPAWHIIENIIQKEIAWLKNNIPTLSEGYRKNPLSLSDDQILRKIAILIVSERIKAVEFRAKRDRDLWNNLTKRVSLKRTSYHGKEWHRKMMDVIYEYFKLRNSKVVLEPILHYGRADLGIYLNRKKVLYIEVGTVSLYKLWHNLSSMRNITFLIIPSEECAVEFKVY